MGRTALIFLIGVASSSQAFARDAYIGTWATERAQCRIGQDQQGAPMIMKARGFDQHETHCTFTSVRPQRGGWRVQGSCSVEGDQQKIGMNLSVANDRLTIKYDDGGGGTYLRCR